VESAWPEHEIEFNFQPSDRCESERLAMIGGYVAGRRGAAIL
jgi:hypothetical protein